MILSFNKQTGARLLKIAKGGMRFALQPYISADKKEVAKRELRSIWRCQAGAWQRENNLGNR
jgi:hypothetical protein